MLGKADKYLRELKAKKNQEKNGAVLSGEY